jgi:hypothetical protein
MVIGLHEAVYRHSTQVCHCFKRLFCRGETCCSRVAERAKTMGSIRAAGFINLKWTSKLGTCAGATFRYPLLREAPSGLPGMHHSRPGILRRRGDCILRTYFFFSIFHVAYDPKCSLGELPSIERAHCVSKHGTGRGEESTAAWLRQV